MIIGTPPLGLFDFAYFAYSAYFASLAYLASSASFAYFYIMLVLHGLHNLHTFQRMHQRWIKYPSQHGQNPLGLNKVESQ